MKYPIWGVFVFCILILARRLSWLASSKRDCSPRQGRATSQLKACRNGKRCVLLIFYLTITAWNYEQWMNIIQCFISMPEKLYNKILIQTDFDFSQQFLSLHESGALSQVIEGIFVSSFRVKSARYPVSLPDKRSRKFIILEIFLYLNFEVQNLDQNSFAFFWFGRLSTKFWPETAVTLGMLSTSSIGLYSRSKWIEGDGIRSRDLSILYM